MAGSAGLEFEIADYISASRLNQKTQFVGTGTQINGLTTMYPGQKAFCTSSGSGYVKNRTYKRNAANDAWEENTDDTGLPYFPLSTTIGDYTTPTTATASSEKDGVEDFTQYHSNQSAADAVWVSGDTSVLRVNVTNDNLGANNTGASTIDKTICYDLGASNLSDSAWEIRFKMVMATLTNRSDTNTQFTSIVLTSNNTTNDALQDAMGFVLGLHSSLGAKYYTYGRDNQALTNYAGTAFTRTPTAETIYVKMIRNGADITVYFYSDSGFTTLLESQALTTSGTISGLRYIKVGHRRSTTSAYGVIDLTIDDIQIVSGITTNPFSYSASKLIDGSITSRGTTNSEANPYERVGMGADVIMVGVAIYYDGTNTTETQIKIQYSTNAASTTYTDLRTINTSDLNIGAWSYILIPAVLGQYIRIYGNSGSTVVLSNYEIKVAKKTSDQFAVGHKHKDISATDTSVPLAA